MKKIFLLFNLFCIDLLAAGYTRPLVHTKETLLDYYKEILGIVVICVGISLFFINGRERFKKDWAWYIASIVIVFSGAAFINSFKG